MEPKDKDVNVPYIVHEGAMARLERVAKRLWIIAILLIILLVGTNGAWIFYESQWETVETTVSQSLDSGDGDVIMNGTGEVNYNGESKTNGISTNP